MLRKSIPSLLVIAVALFAFSTKAFGQIVGCDESPEDPTVVLALIGSAAVAFPVLRGKIRNRKLSK
jgi:XrtJ-associated TM-motif-TM protein